MPNENISVAMCTFNGERYLPIQLESILNQAFLPSEIIICDDGSKDKTVEIIESYKTDCAVPIKVYINERPLGPASNFGKAISLTNGDLIVLSDQDDVWNRDKLKLLVNTFRRESGASYVFSNANLMDAYGSLYDYSLWDRLNFSPDTFSATSQVQLLLQRNVVTGAGLAFKSSLKKHILPVEGGWMHDHWIALLGSLVSRGVALDEKLFTYRLHQSQACGINKHSFFSNFYTSCTTNAQSFSLKIDSLEALIRRSAVGLANQNHLKDLLADKVRHLKTRQRIRQSTMIERSKLVLSEFLHGGYQRYSMSKLSALRDLFP